MSAGESYMVPINDVSELSNPIARAYYSLSEKGRTVVMVVGTRLRHTPVKRHAICSIRR